MSEKRFTDEEITNRMNWLGDQDKKVRASLRHICEINGHIKSGGFFCTANPIHVCFQCGAKFQIENGKENTWTDTT